MERKRVLAWSAGVAAVVLLAVAALAVAIATDPAATQDWRHQRLRPPAGAESMLTEFETPGISTRMAQQLGLSAGQQQAIRDVVDQARPGLRRLRDQARVSAELLARTRPDDSSYTTVVSNTSAAASELAAQPVLQGSRLRSQVFGVLTPAQKSQLVELQNQMLDERVAAARVRLPASPGEAAASAASGRD